MNGVRESEISLIGGGRLSGETFGKAVERHAQKTKINLSRVPVGSGSAHFNKVDLDKVSDNHEHVVGWAHDNYRGVGVLIRDGENLLERSEGKGTRHWIEAATPDFSRFLLAIGSQAKGPNYEYVLIDGDKTVELIKGNVDQVMVWPPDPNLDHIVLGFRSGTGVGIRVYDQEGEVRDQVSVAGNFVNGPVIKAVSPDASIVLWQAKYKKDPSWWSGAAEGAYVNEKTVVQDDSLTLYADSDASAYVVIGASERKKNLQVVGSGNAAGFKIENVQAGDVVFAKDFSYGVIEVIERRGSRRFLAFSTSNLSYALSDAAYDEVKIKPDENSLTISAKGHEGPVGLLKYRSVSYEFNVPAN